MHCCTHVLREIHRLVILYVQCIDSGLPLQIDESADVYGFIAENLGATWH